VPILPGVVQVEWAAVLARRHFPLPPDFQSLEQLKFRKVIRPQTEVTLTLSCLPSGKGVEFRYASDAGEHSRGRIRFGG
jgi:3-hydroxymyristoyl/3-hydroxydecanoyl-(acyl carrier protein) dehydratase